MFPVSLKTKQIQKTNLSLLLYLTHALNVAIAVCTISAHLVRITLQKYYLVCKQAYYSQKLCISTLNKKGD